MKLLKGRIFTEWSGEKGEVHGSIKFVAVGVSLVHILDLLKRLEVIAHHSFELEGGTWLFCNAFSAYSGCPDFMNEDENTSADGAPFRIILFLKVLIVYFSSLSDEWTVEELSTVIKVPPMKLRREAVFWLSLGLLKEAAPDRYVLLEKKGGRLNIFWEPPLDDDERESVMASAQDQREEELGVFWSYIVGMLTNLESMPLDRIHQMLKMFATQGPSSVDCNQIELQTFLDRKVREHKLLFSGGLYRLPKL